MTLYEIDRALVALMSETNPETGELLASPEDWDALQMERNAKLEGTACYIKELRARIGALKDETKTLQARQKALESKEAWLLENLRRSLDGESFETAKCQVKFKRNPVSVRISDEDEVMAWAREYAPDCLRYKPATISLSDIKAELKKGVMVPGAELVRETRLEVR